MAKKRDSLEIPEGWVLKKRVEENGTEVKMNLSKIDLKIAARVELRAAITYLEHGLPMSGDRPGVLNLSGPYALCAIRESSSAFDIFTSEF
ncbi:hypothetical protein ACE6H2_028119 [Prunus campanulata]